MSQEIYFVASTPERARQVVAQIKQTGVVFKDISVIDEPSQVKRIAHPQSEEFRNALKGSIAGAAIGLFYGAATLAVIGAAAIPGVLGASLILGYAAFGGILFGAIIGSTGIFARPRMPASLEHKYEEEVSRGRTLVSVQLDDPKEQKKFMAAVDAWGLSEIGDSGEPAA